MKILNSILIILFFYSCNDQNIYELNKAELENCYSCRPKKKNPYPKQDWVQTDLTRYREMINPISELKPIISEYLTVYPSLLSGKGNSSSRTIELLDDLKLISHDFYGGYTSFNLKILIYNDLIIFSKLYTEVEDNVFENIYLKEITIPLTCSGTSMEYFKIHDENLTEYKKAYPNFTLEIDINKYTTDELNAYYNLNEVEYNYSTYQVDEDYPHLANGFIKTLLEQEKYEVLEKLLFGANPVARIYSYTGLKIAIRDGYIPDSSVIKQMKNIKRNGLKFKSGINSSHSVTTDFDFTNKLNFE